jgi:hypothetical protein
MSGSASSPFRDRLKQFYTRRGIAKTDQELDSALDVWKGREEEMFAALEKKYSAPSATAAPVPVPAPQPAATPKEPQSFQSRLQNLFESNDPKRVVEIENLLSLWSGREDQLIASLEREYAAKRANAEAYRARLVAFYEKNDPPKLPLVDKALEAWKGREEEMFVALEQKYAKKSAAATANDPKAATPAASSPTVPVVDQRYKERLKQLYAKWGKDKSEQDVINTLAQWKGREEEMLLALDKKYASGAGSGSPAQQGTDHKQRLRAFYGKYAPEKKEEDVDKALEVWKGREEEMFTALAKKYNVNAEEPSSLPPPPAPAPPPSAPSNPHRARLKAFYAKYAREKGEEDVDKALEVWKGREEEMFAALAKKYNVPVEESGSSSVASASPHRSRLKAFYAKHAPEKTEEDLDKALEVWKGREEEMFTALAKKYNVPVEPGSPANRGGGGGGGGAPAAPANPHRARLKAFYAKYAPEKKEDDVDKALEVWKGREEEMFAALTKKYNVPLSAAALPPARDRLIQLFATYSPGKSPEMVDRLLENWVGREEELVNVVEARLTGRDNAPDYKGRLIEFYKKNAPECLPDVDKVLDVWLGRENELFPYLERKHSVEGGARPPVATDSAQPTSPSSHDPIRQRLKEFYSKHAPEKTEADIDRALATWKGREEEMFTTLRKKYGLSAPDDPRSRLQLFYSIYAPEKPQSDIEKALTTWQGRENEMFSALENKYKLPAGSSSMESLQRQRPMASSPQLAGQEGERPTLSSSGSGPLTRGLSFKDQLVNVYRQYAPEKPSGEIDRALETWSGREEDMFNALSAKYRIPPDELSRLRGYDGSAVMVGGLASPSSVRAPKDIRPVRERLVAFCQHRCPEKVSEVDDMLRVWQGKEEDMFAQLVSKFGPEPNLGTEAVTLSPEKREKKTLRDRLESFYEERGLQMDVDADKALQLWKGREEELFRALERKYGPPKHSAKTKALAMVSRAEAREKLIDLYRTYAPEKLGVVDRTLELWNGREAEMLQTLARKYRALEDGRSALEEDPAIATDLLTKRISAMYFRYLADRLNELPSVLEAHEGNEGELLESLVVRFGPEPDPYDIQSRIERMYGYYEPGKVKEARALAAQARGREDFVMRTMVKRYGPEPGAKYVVPPSTVIATNPRNDRHRIRLTRWLMLRCPKRAPEVDYFLVRFAGRESQLFRLMAEVMGPEPKDEPLEETVRSKFLTTPALAAYFAKRQSPPFLNWLWNGTLDRDTTVASKPAPYATASTITRDRLVRFYNHYHPIKVAEVDETLARWRGREELLFEALVHKYGAEPLSETPLRTEPSSLSAKAGSRQGQSLSPPGLQSNSATPRAILQSFYAVQNPSKLKDIESTLERFQGREEVLYHMLQTKYGANPMILPDQLAAAQTGNQDHVVGIPSVIRKPPTL